MERVIKVREAECILRDPDTGILCKQAAKTLLVPSKPPMKEYLVAPIDPTNPCALRNPNSIKVFPGPAALLIIS
jgi:hypothetical protein